MGIPGLKKRVESQCAVQHDCGYLKNGLFYIDGLNLLYQVYRDLPRDKQLSSYDSLYATILPLIQNILSLEPSKTTIYFDVVLPTDDIALDKATRRFRIPKIHRLTTIGYDLFTFLIRNHFPNIDIVLTASAAEDRIANDIFVNLEKELQELSEPYLMHVIFSDDSDCYTFSMSNAHKVEIVPLSSLSRKWPWPTITTVNLNKAHSMVSWNHRKAVPLPEKTIWMGKQEGILQNIHVPRMLVQFRHTIGVHHIPMIRMPLIHSPHDVPEPYEIAHGIRMTIYGLIFQQEDGVGETKVVSEMQQSCGQMIIKKSNTLTSNELVEQVEYLTNTPIKQIIMDQFQAVKPKFNLSHLEINAIGTYIDHLQEGADISKTENLHDAVPKLYSLLMAVLVSLQLFYGNTSCSFDDCTYLLLWKISPYELSTYLHANTFVDEDPQDSSDSGVIALGSPTGLQLNFPNEKIPIEDAPRVRPSARTDRAAHSQALRSLVDRLTGPVTPSDIASMLTFLSYKLERIDAILANLAETVASSSATVASLRTTVASLTETVEVSVESMSTLSKAVTDTAGRVIGFRNTILSSIDMQACMLDSYIHRTNSYLEREADIQRDLLKSFQNDVATIKKRHIAQNDHNLSQTVDSSKKRKLSELS